MSFKTQMHIFSKTIIFFVIPSVVYVKRIPGKLNNIVLCRTHYFVYCRLAVCRAPNRDRH